ncbi:hypothetical protein OG985_46030 [Streptomyces sp. NBC_00289]|uniref:hypothetical protein n=1 Tax=Streptomyces sp. NBC_00289 TaxID=2975703 RepID=UPI0032448C20
MDTHNPDLVLATLNGKGKLEPGPCLRRYITTGHLDTGRGRDVGGGDQTSQTMVTGPSRRR